MAIRTWQTLAPRPAFAYGSLALLAHAIGRLDVTVIADARRSSWHAQKLGQPLSRLPAEELKGPLVTPSHFRTWSPEPAGTIVHDYAVEHLIGITKEMSLFRPTESPDAFLHHDPSFAMWSPTIHRAPVSSTREG
jgi:tRNA threonylcarbamoyladenosine biosynthesis protein TsaB